MYQGCLLLSMLLISFFAFLRSLCFALFASNPVKHHGEGKDVKEFFLRAKRKVGMKNCLSLRFCCSFFYIKNVPKDRRKSWAKLIFGWIFL